MFWGLSLYRVTGKKPLTQVVGTFLKPFSPSIVDCDIPILVCFQNWHSLFYTEWLMCRICQLWFDPKIGTNWVLRSTEWLPYHFWQLRVGAHAYMAQSTIYANVGRISDSGSPVCTRNFWRWNLNYRNGTSRIFASALFRTATNPQQNIYFSSENRVVPLSSTLLQLWNALLLQTSYPSAHQLTRAVDIFESDIVKFLACKTPWATTS